MLLLEQGRVSNAEDPNCAVGDYGPTVRHMNNAHKTDQQTPPKLGSAFRAGAEVAKGRGGTRPPPPPSANSRRRRHPGRKTLAFFAIFCEFWQKMGYFG